MISLGLFSNTKHYYTNDTYLIRVNEEKSGQQWNKVNRFFLIWPYNVSTMANWEVIFTIDYFGSIFQHKTLLYKWYSIRVSEEESGQQWNKVNRLFWFCQYNGKLISNIYNWLVWFYFPSQDITI